MKTIEIIISPTGQTQLKTTGYQGRDCLEATRQLEAALGCKNSDRLTPEFYSQSSQSEEQQLRRRC